MIMQHFLVLFPDVILKTSELSCFTCIAQKSYWCGTMQNNKEDVEVDNSQMQQTEYFEKDPLGMRAGIRIKNLRKVSLHLEILLCCILFAIQNERLQFRDERSEELLCVSRTVFYPRSGRHSCLK